MRSAPFENSGDTGGDILEELLRLEDGKFVRAAYERLLGRSPAEQELDLWLAPLRGGSRSKLDVLAAIRYSTEGRARGVSLPGLMAPRETGWMQRLPIVGYAIRWIQQLATLPRLARRLESMEATLTANASIDARRADCNGTARSRRQFSFLRSGRQSALDVPCRGSHFPARASASMSKGAGFTLVRR